jgi:hypothetical protein
MNRQGLVLLGAISVLIFGSFQDAQPAFPAQFIPSASETATSALRLAANPTITQTPSLTPTATPNPNSTPTPVSTIGTGSMQVFLPSVFNALQVVSVSPGSDPFILAAGDIADCNLPNDYQTASIIQSYPQGEVLTLGDNAYQDGTPQEFATCYAPAWGPFLSRTHPSVGNHDYQTKGAVGYYNYFGAAAGAANQGYYSFDIGSWHLIALNSECLQIGGCGVGSAQELWLKNDLAMHPAQCTLAFWHRPLYSSGKEGSALEVQPLWQDLYDAGVDVVLNGHDHIYERFAPQDPLGIANSEKGIMEFVVGTGGYQHSPIHTLLSNSLVHDNTTFGVLELTLHSNSFDWAFLPVPGGTFTDSGSANCH